MSGEARGQQLIVGCLTATAVVAAGSTAFDGDGRGPGMRLVVGVSVAAATLATVNMFAPDIAGGMAVLVLTTTVFVYGGPLFDAIAYGLGQSSPMATPGKVRSTPTQEGTVSA